MEAVAGSRLLKRANANSLFLVLAGNIAAFFLARAAGAFDFFDWAKLVGAIASAWPAGLGATLTGILNAQVSGDFKAKLVFLRWHHALPGSRAFTRLGPPDPRVNMAELARRFGPLPYPPDAQNLLWYRLFQRVEEQPAVMDLHRQYLFARDYTFVALVFFLSLGAAASVLIRPAQNAAVYIAVLALQWALVTRAAQDRGNRLVTTVLARNST